MIGASILASVAFGSVYAGLWGWPLYVIPILGIGWSVGYALYRPYVRLALRRSLVLSGGLWIWNSMICGVIYALADLFGHWIHV